MAKLENGITGRLIGDIGASSFHVRNAKNIITGKRIRTGKASLERLKQNQDIFKDVGTAYSIAREQVFQMQSDMNVPKDFSSELYLKYYYTYLKNIIEPVYIFYPVVVDDAARKVTWKIVPPVDDKIIGLIMEDVTSVYRIDKTIIRFVLRTNPNVNTFLYIEQSVNLPNSGRFFQYLNNLPNYYNIVFYGLATPNLSKVYTYAITVALSPQTL